MRSLKLVVSLYFFLACNVQALEQLEDRDLSRISGAEGVQLTLRLRNNVDATGNPIGCAGVLNRCRMGLEFSGREGIWLMLKDYYGVLAINDIRLEGATLPVGNTVHVDFSRFLASDETTCLITGCNPAGMLAVRVTYPFSKTVGEYKDFSLLVNIGRTALEYDDPITSAPGYMRDNAAGSVLGFRMADSQGLNAPSKARFDGAAYVFGF